MMSKKQKKMVKFHLNEKKKKLDMVVHTAIPVIAEK
jgi:hypothetical protein